MPAWSKIAQTACPVARVQSIVGDRWTVLILRELLMGNSRFDEIQAQTEATPQMLASRLKKLEEEGVIERRTYNTRPLRHEYILTEMGLDFFPIIHSMREWGEKWCKSSDEGVAAHYTHIPCGQDPGLGAVCQACGIEVKRSELKLRLDPSYAKERTNRMASFKAERS